MGVLDSIKDGVIWDFDLKDEFNNRSVGFGFVIDVCDGVPRLALYRMKKRLSDSNILQQQPDRELLDKALQDQGLTKLRDNLYPITGDVRKWIEENLL
ncbi:MAG: hypothetical protein VR69_15860 [Peptococcaceae bacterium BRH_c4b]|nr:MAG: hypothetical protein VR69_15860 [Peptococcaceae bacterium BRH_c4b]